MKTAFLSCMVAGMACACQAVGVVWLHSFSDSAVVHAGSDYSISEYAERILGSSLDNVAYRIRVLSDSSYMDFYYGVEFGFFPGEEGNQVAGSGDGYEYIRHQQARVGDSDSLDWSAEAVVELGLLDDDWNWAGVFALSDTFVLDSIRSDTYEQGTILPTVPGTWLSDFYAVPEPSIPVLLVLGLLVILLRRKRCPQL